MSKKVIRQHPKKSTDSDLGLYVPIEKKNTEDVPIRVVCVSDIHSSIPSRIPKGDILICAGDLSSFYWTSPKSWCSDRVRSLANIDDWFGGLLKKNHYKYIVCIAGNHDSPLAQDTYTITNAIYLKDSFVDLTINDRTIKIYGSPWTANYGGCWDFQLSPNELLDKWKMIPSDVDILVTHGPPKGHGDLSFFSKRMGCDTLLDEIRNRIKPILHIFGHIHEGWGVTCEEGLDTLFVNSSIWTFFGERQNEALFFDF